VSRIDPATASVTATVHIGGGPSSIAVGKRAVWVSAEFAERVVKLDPREATPRIVDSLRVDNRPKGVAVGAGGCWVAVQASGRGHRGGRLVVLVDVISGIDPAVAQSNSIPIVNGLVYDGLTAPRRSGGSDGTQLVPDLAATLPAPTDGGKTYTFRLRSGIRYSSGVPVRPADFRRSLERALTLSPDFFEAWNVVGSGACTRGVRCDLSRGILTTAGTVTFKLTAPNPRFLLLLASVNPIPAGTPAKAIAAKPPVGTGPYRVENFVPGRELTLVRNPHFHVWSPAARPDGYPDEIVFRIGQGGKAVDAVARGRADIVLGGAPSDRVPELKARFPSQLHLVPQNATTFVFLNTRRPPFDDPRVRRAVNFAVDRAKVAVLHGGADLAQPTCQTLPPDLPGYVRYCPYTVSPDASGEWKAPDLARAKALIAASHTRGEKVVVWTFPFFGKEARYMVSLLRQLGYRARLKELPDIDSYFGTLAKAHPQAGFAGWFGVQIADDIFASLSCTFSQNWAEFCDHGLDAQVEKLSREEAENSAAARRLAARIDRTIVDRAPWVPLFTPRLPDFVSERVGNYQYNIYDLGVLLDQLWVR
jgi:ABC-type transport system substrate-binding protein